MIIFLDIYLKVPDVDLKKELDVVSSGVLGGQWKFSGDKHKSLQVDTERTFHQRYPLVML